VAVALCLLLPSGTLGLTTDEPGVPDVAADVLFFELSAVLLPYLVPICLVALLAGALNSHGVFALPAFGPVVLNVFWIGGLLLAVAMGITAPADVGRFVTWFLLAAGCVQFVVLAGALRRRNALPRPDFAIPRAGDPARAVFTGMLPAILGLSVTQLNTLVDQSMAVGLVAPGANNYVYLANRLLLFPHALTSMAMAVAVFPRLSRLAGSGRHDEFHDELDRILAFSVFLSVPASAGLVLVGPDLVPLLFEHGAFTAADSRETWLATALLVAGLPALGVAQLYARGIYALGDVKTPARIAGYLVIANLGLNLLFVSVAGLGAAGLTLATAVSATLNALALGIVIHRRTGASAPRTRGRRGLARGAAAAGAMAAGVWGVRALLPPAASGADTGERAWRVAATIVPAVLAYGVAHLAMDSPEAAAIRAALRRHFAKRK